MIGIIRDEKKLWPRMSINHFFSQLRSIFVNSMVKKPNGSSTFFSPIEAFSHLGEKRGRSVEEEQGLVLFIYLLDF